MSATQKQNNYDNKKRGNMIFHSVPLSEGKYTTVQNSVWYNLNLSDRAVRILGLLLLHRNNPTFEMNSFFLSQSLNCSEKKIYRAFDELKLEGYLLITNTHKMKGNARVYDYEIFEDPSLNKQNQLPKEQDKSIIQNNVTKVMDKLDHSLKKENKTINNKENNNVNKASEEQRNLETTKINPDFEFTFKKYIALRPNDLDFKNQLTLVFQDDTFNISFAHDWLEARSYIKTDKNLAYYLLDCLRGRKGLPEEFIAVRNEIKRKAMFENWHKEYYLIQDEQLNITSFENNLANFAGEIVQSLLKVKSYFALKTIDEKSNEKLIKEVGFCLRYLKKISENINLSKLTDLVTTILETPTFKVRDRFLRTLQDNEISSVINTISMITYYAEKEVI